MLATQAVAAAKQEQPARARETSRPVKQERKDAQTLEQRLAQKLDAARKYRGTVRFFANRRELFSSATHRPNATSAVRHARHRLRQLSTTIGTLRTMIRKREMRRRAHMPPRAAICQVFRKHCRAALAVAWCESRLATTAQNGQYLGLFQMGSYERRVFGHGRTALAQAVAAHRYFVRSGSDWSPWSCKPGYPI